MDHLATLFWFWCPVTQWAGTKVQTARFFDCCIKIARSPDYLLVCMWSNATKAKPCNHFVAWSRSTLVHCGVSTETPPWYLKLCSRPSTPGVWAPSASRAKRLIKGISVSRHLVPKQWINAHHCLRSNLKSSKFTSWSLGKTISQRITSDLLLSVLAGDIEIICSITSPRAEYSNIKFK